MRGVRTGEQASESFHLVGHDWNGQIAWSTVIRAPERVKTRSVLSCPNADSVNPTACPQIRKTPGDAHMAIPPNELPEGTEHPRISEARRALSAHGPPRTRPESDVPCPRDDGA